MGQPATKEKEQEEGEEAEEEEDPSPVDTKPECEESCKPRCVKQLLHYEACIKRVEGSPGKHCTGQYFDYWGCIDKCAAPKIFRTLK
jgi:ubiquinol-cytochrome c reductase subunit 6